jgi:hypothetical protein
MPSLLPRLKMCSVVVIDRPIWSDRPTGTCLTAARVLGDNPASAKKAY